VITGAAAGTALGHMAKKNKASRAIWPNLVQDRVIEMPPECRTHHSFDRYGPVYFLVPIQFLQLQCH
jgi:hypothetical protein